mgnify:CR=1 FL=1
MLSSVRHRLLFRTISVLSVLFLCPRIAGAQKLLTVNADFSSAWISPDWLQNTNGDISIDNIISGSYAGSFRPGKSPYMTFGTDQSPYWLHFIIRNTDSVSRSLVLRLNRKNIARFELWQKRPDGSSPLYLGKVGADRHNDIRYELTDGFQFPVILPKGDSEFWAKTSNHIGSMYLNLGLYTPEDFGMVSRRNIILLGIFLGVMLVSFVFSLVLFIQYRDTMYVLYAIYILNILIRELYFYSVDFGLLSHLGRHRGSVGLLSRHQQQLAPARRDQLRDGERQHPWLRPRRHLHQRHLAGERLVGDWVFDRQLRRGAVTAHLRPNRSRRRRRAAELDLRDALHFGDVEHRAIRRGDLDGTEHQRRQHSHSIPP